jgi:hypothetical protein
MGLFGSRGDRLRAIEAKMQAKVPQELAKARQKALLSGLNVAGTIEVAQGQDFTRPSFLFVYADRIDLVKLGQGGVMIGKGAGTESIPIARISSVQSNADGGYSKLKLFTSGSTIEFKTHYAVGPYLRQLISGMLNEAVNPTPVVVSSPIIESPTAGTFLAPESLLPLAEQPEMPSRTPGIVTWAFVLSLLGMCGITAVIALILGFVGRREAKKFGGAPEEIRTPNLLIRSQMLYPLSYGRLVTCEV